MPLVLKDLEAGFLYASYVRTGLPFDFETLEADSMHVHIAFWFSLDFETDFLYVSLFYFRILLSWLPVSPFDCCILEAGFLYYVLFIKTYLKLIFWLICVSFWFSKTRSFLPVKYQACAVYLPPCEWDVPCMASHRLLRMAAQQPLSFLFFFVSSSLYAFALTTYSCKRMRVVVEPLAFPGVAYRRGKHVGWRPSFIRQVSRSLRTYCSVLVLV